jgi:hypothetical protein
MPESRLEYSGYFATGLAADDLLYSEQTLNMALVTPSYGKCKHESSGWSRMSGLAFPVSVQITLAESQTDMVCFPTRNTASFF